MLRRARAGARSPVGLDCRYPCESAAVKFSQRPSGFIWYIRNARLKVTAWKHTTERKLTRAGVETNFAQAYMFSNLGNFNRFGQVWLKPRSLSEEGRPERSKVKRVWKCSSQKIHTFVCTSTSILHAVLTCALQSEVKREDENGFVRIGFSFKLPLHTYRLQRSNHRRRVRLRDVTCVEARMMTVKGNFTETLLNKFAKTAMFIRKTNLWLRTVCVYWWTHVYCVDIIKKEYKIFYI